MGNIKFERLAAHRSVATKKISMVPPARPGDRTPSKTWQSAKSRLRS